MEQNEQLTAENAELRQQMVDYDRIKAENEAYKALANIQEKNSNATYVSGFVIGRDPLDEFGGFTLDKGTADGVAVNDAVISDRGYLLGMVVEADPTSCKVMTILHPSFNAAGVVSRTRENGILNGNTTYAADGLCTLTNLERSTETHAGGSGHHHRSGRGVPPDLLVGTVQDVVPEASGKSSIAVVRPGADPPHRQARFYHYCVLRRAHCYGISPQAQPQSDAEVGLLCSGAVCVRRVADHARAFSVGAGKAAAGAAAVSGGGGI